MIFLCEKCRRSFERRPSDVKGRRVFCSPACKGEADRRTLDEKFWPKVVITPDCWLWVGSTKQGGYGKISCSYGNRTKSILASHVSWELHFGPVTEGEWVLHHCDNPSCVRPDHLFTGTVLDNVRDMDLKGRRISLSGVRQPRSKLDPIAISYAESQIGSRSQRSIARALGVSHCSLHKALSGKTWVSGRAEPLDLG